MATLYRDWEMQETGSSVQSEVIHLKKADRRGKIVVLAALLLLTSLPVTTQATSTKEQLEQAERERAESQAQVENAKGSVDNLEDAKQGLQGQLSQLNNQLDEVVQNLEQLEDSIAAKEKEIELTSAALEEAKLIEQEQYESMKQRIRFMYERSQYTYAEMLLSAGSLAEFLNRSEYINKLAEYDRNMLEEFEQTREEIAETEILLQTEKEELDALHASAVEEQKKVSGLVSNTANGIASYADQISATEAAIEAKEAEIREQEANIAYLRKKLAEEQALSSLAANSSWRDISEVTFDEGDRYLLANLIYCEAGGEPYAGQVAVGAVVINRVLSSVFPDTVVGVIYQNKQFSPVASGRLALALAENRATERCYQAADEAMSGMTNVGGCVFFRTPIEGLSGISIGGHIFY